MTYNNKSYVVKYKIDILLKNNVVLEPSIKYTINKYGHISDFLKLSIKQKEEAYRVISSLAIKLAGIEESYSATDINGNTYDFEIFQDGNFRVTRIERFNKDKEEVLDERYSKKNN